MDPHRPPAPLPEDGPPPLETRFPACHACRTAVEYADLHCAACNARRPTGDWPEDARIGTTILDGLELRERIGYGATGAVYAGFRPGSTEAVAVKLLRHDLTTDAELVRRFRLEAVVTKALAIPQVVAARDFGVLPDGTHYLTMDRVLGTGLDRVLQATPRLRIDVALEITRQILVALDITHSRGVVHRDLKPGNLILDREDDGRPLVRILDFGFAKVLADPDLAPGLRLTRGLTVMGTPQYMSPEQCRGSRSIDGRTDLYSLGVILYRMLSGVSPFDAPTCAEVIRMQLEQRPEPPSTRWPDVPPELDRLVLWMLEKDPDARPRTASNVLGELERHFPERDSSRDIQRTAAMAGNRSEIIRQIDRHVAPMPGGEAVTPALEDRGDATPRAPARTEGRGRRVAIGVTLAVLTLATAVAAWWVGR